MEAPVSTSKATAPKPDHGKANASSQSHMVKYDILAHLKLIYGPLSIYYALQMLRKLRKVLVMALMCPNLYKSYPKSTKICASCMLAITFDEDDFFLGSKFHNQPLYNIIFSLIELSKVDSLCLTKKYSQQKPAHGSCILMG